MKKLTLAETQSRFKAILKSENLPDQDPIGIKEAKSLGFADRYEIYHYAYFARIQESLSDDYARVREAIGEEEFSTWVRDYLERYPSRYASLAQTGQDFPAFVLEKSRDQALADLARFEWLSCLCKWSETPSIRSFRELASLPEEEQLSQVLELAPTHFLLESAYRPQDRDFRSAGPTTLVLYRASQGLQILEVAPERREFIDALMARKTLGGILESVPFEPSWLTEWSAKALITGFSKPLKPR